MNFKFGNIEEFFLNTLLRISIFGVFSILVSDIVLYPADTISISIDAIILTALVVSYSVRKKYPTAAVMIFTSSLSPQDEQQFAQQGIAFYSKPSNFLYMKKIMSDMAEVCGRN